MDREICCNWLLSQSKSFLKYINGQRNLLQLVAFSVQKLLKVYKWTEKSAVIGYSFSPKGCFNYKWTEKSVVTGYFLSPKGCSNYK